MKRKLASVQVIRKVTPIEGADRVVLATIEGFKCVVPKDLHVGDKVIYVETDSVCPKTEMFEFLGHNRHIKLRKIRGVFSQGLAIPYHGTLPVGTDLTEELGITKYEPPQTPEDTLGARPPYVPKTDEVRAQNIVELLTKYKGIPCFATEKLDGSSCTVFKYKDHIGVCTRNRELTEDSGMYTCAKKLGIIDFLESYDGNIALQGEYVGHKIQGNRLHLDEHHIYIFSVFNIDTQLYFSELEMRNLMEKAHIDCVPMVCGLTLDDNVDDLIELAKGNSVFGNFPREGVVIRPCAPINGLNGFPAGRFSFKVINPEYQWSKGE